MATLEQKIACEREARAMLEREELPPPDAVEYDHDCVRLFWDEPRICLAIEIDVPPGESGSAGTLAVAPGFREALLNPEPEGLGY